jgi:hypothetical protein
MLIVPCNLGLEDDYLSSNFYRAFFDKILGYLSKFFNNSPPESSATNLSCRTYRASQANYPQIQMTPFFAGFIVDFNFLFGVFFEIKITEINWA